MQRLTITISREFGSGGRWLGEKLAEALNFEFYDRSLITAAAQESGFAPEIFESAEDQAANKLLFNLAIGGCVSTSVFAQAHIPLCDRVFSAQSKVISRLAEKGGCVIIGRCGNYILRNDPNCLKVFVCCSLPDRARRAAGNLKISPSEAEALCAKTDKGRTNYYEYYTDWQWGDPHSFDLTLNTGFLRLEEALALLLKAAKTRFSRTTNV